MPVTETYGSIKPQPSDTRRVLLGKILNATLSGGGGGGSGQVEFYTASDPNTQGLIPADITKAAIAYKKDGTGPDYGWNPDTLTWV